MIGSRRACTLVEYDLILGLISLVTIAALCAYGPAIVSLLSQ